MINRTRSPITMHQPLGLLSFLFCLFVVSICSNFSVRASKPQIRNVFHWVFSFIFFSPFLFYFGRLVANKILAFSNPLNAPLLFHSFFSPLFVNFSSYLFFSFFLLFFAHLLQFSFYARFPPLSLCIINFASFLFFLFAFLSSLFLEIQYLALAEIIYTACFES